MIQNLFFFVTCGTCQNCLERHGEHDQFCMTSRVIRVFSSPQSGTRGGVDGANSAFFRAEEALFFSFGLPKEVTWTGAKSDVLERKSDVALPRQLPRQLV